MDGNIISQSKHTVTLRYAICPETWYFCFQRIKTNASRMFREDFEWDRIIAYSGFGVDVWHLRCI